MSTSCPLDRLRLRRDRWSTPRRLSSRRCGSSSPSSASSSAPDRWVAAAGHAWGQIDWTDELHLATEGAIDRDEARSRKHAFSAELDAATVLRPGLMTLLDEALAHSIPMGVASNSPSSWIESTPRTARASRITSTRVVTIDRVERGKPHPDPYLAAVALLDAPATRSVAFEDSEAGSRSAAAGGAVRHRRARPHDGRTTTSLQLTSRSTASMGSRCSKSRVRSLAPGLTPQVIACEWRREDVRKRCSSSSTARTVLVVCPTSSSSRSRSRSVSTTIWSTTTMRTPGHDFELAVGFLAQRGPAGGRAGEDGALLRHRAPRSRPSSTSSASRQAASPRCRPPA